MCFRKLLLLSLLLSEHSICENLDGEKNDPRIQEPFLGDRSSVEDTFEDTTVEEEFSFDPTTTTASTTTSETTRRLTLVVPEEKNVSGHFRPSVHLGEIKESRINTSPFNNVQHISFENEPGAYQEQLKDFKVVFQPTEESATEEDPRANFHQSYFETVGSEESNKEMAEQSGYVKFQDNTVDVPRIRYVTVLQDQPLQFAQPVQENAGTRYELMDQQMYQNMEKPVYEQGTPVFYGKPAKFQTETQKQELGSVSSVNSLAAPYFNGVYGHQSHMPVSHYFHAPKKPNNGVVYVQESTFMRTRKFPYSFYQPPVGYHDVEFVNDEHPGYPLRNRVSPWKKILHLIGAFLPLGLLLAALTPNVVRIDNTTQPNIVLSKWRAADLPVEHKLARIAGGPSNDCEERSICALILAGGEAGSSVLQNALWNLATRTSTTIAKENGLQEVFEAVKRRDCSKIIC